MHRADRDVLERVERSFQEGGLPGAQDPCDDSSSDSKHCVLAALLDPEQVTSPFAIDLAAKNIGRSDVFVGFLVMAFDDWPVLDELVFESGTYDDEGDYNDRSRGYRAGWKCAQTQSSQSGRPVTPVAAA